jgi:hypothetical protein
MRFYIHKNYVLHYCHVWCRLFKCCRIWGFQVRCVGVSNLLVCCCVAVSPFPDTALVCQETNTVTHSTRLDAYSNLQEGSTILKIRDSHIFSISKQVYQLSAHKVRQESMEIKLKYKIWGSYSSATTGMWHCHRLSAQDNYRKRGSNMKPHEGQIEAKPNWTTQLVKNCH